MTKHKESKKTLTHPTEHAKGQGKNEKTLEPVIVRESKNCVQCWFKFFSLRSRGCFREGVPAATATRGCLNLELLQDKPFFDPKEFECSVGISKSWTSMRL